MIPALCVSVDRARFELARARHKNHRFNQSVIAPRRPQTLSSFSLQCVKALVPRLMHLDLLIHGFVETIAYDTGCTKNRNHGEHLY